MASPESLVLKLQILGAARYLFHVRKQVLVISLSSIKK
jgi:hypothetical protein